MVAAIRFYYSWKWQSHFQEFALRHCVRLILVALCYFRLFGVVSSYFSASMPRFSPTRGRFFINVLHSSVENPVDNVENYDWIYQLSLLIIYEEPT